MHYFLSVWEHGKASEVGQKKKKRLLFISRQLWWMEKYNCDTVFEGDEESASPENFVRREENWGLPRCILLSLTSYGNSWQWKLRHYTSPCREIIFINISHSETLKMDV
ncbi:hypothetical protein CDL12_18448 [Handroanthus impetiginosus]|uniref:Uncharacterized protein n=1 Tax=Handroanthus impetiginosus TaxID=429701 RepID=A0A2G9GUR2_9LAMI|nr:hypothetical protein CDL12_18448 [Handroanthus impetiginosus]